MPQYRDYMVTFLIRLVANSGILIQKLFIFFQAFFPGDVRHRIVVVVPVSSEKRQ